MTVTHLQPAHQDEHRTVEEQLPYEAPQVVSYTDEQILMELGPAQANNSPLGGSVL